MQCRYAHRGLTVHSKRFVSWWKSTRVGLVLSGRHALAFVICLSMVAILPPLLPVPAEAQSWRQSDPSAIVLPGQPGNRQSSGERGGLFRLFRFEPRRQSQPRQPQRGTTRSTTSSGTFQSAPAQRALPPPPPPKDFDARSVVAIGDEFADQFHVGMVDRLDGNRRMQSFGVSIPGTGLTNPEAFDWVAEAPSRINRFERVAAVVVALGYSDARTLINGDQRHAFGSSQWRQFYRNRVTTLALTLLGEGNPVIFVGLPPMADPTRNEEVRLINQVLEEGVAPTLARFVSVYEGFADEQGNYVRAGPSLAGDVVNLRNRDGIFLNRAGRQKYAQFAERFIPLEGQEVLEPQVSSIIYEGSARSADGVGPVILLTSGFADPTASLIDDVERIVPEERETLDRLTRGTLIEAPPTRADFFRAPG